MSPGFFRDSARGFSPENRNSGHKSDFRNLWSIGPSLDLTVTLSVQDDRKTTDHIVYIPSSLIPQALEAKNAKIGLEILQPDVWACIISLVPGEQVGRLKMTGAKSLWAHLCLPTAVKSIKLGADGLKLKKWPAFLNELGSVEELKISSAVESWWNSWYPKLSDLPWKLKKLNLGSLKISVAAFFVGSDGKSLSLSHYMPTLEELEIAADWSPENPWLTHNWPNLITLSCLVWNTSSPLPESLIHLNTQYYIEVADSSLILPSKLQTLNTNGISKIEYFMPLLPPALTSLIANGRLDPRFRIPWDTCFKLPSTLTKIEEIRFPFNFEHPSLTTSPKTIFKLPVTLTELCVLNLPFQIWPHLPKSLKVLKLKEVGNTAIQPLNIAENNVNKEISTIPLYSIPRSITKLEIQFVNLTLLDCTPPRRKTGSKSFFPSSLNCLILENAQLTVNSAKHLPASLTQLELPNLDFQVCKYLPRDLKTLRVTAAVMMNPDLVAFIPRSLTSLDMMYGRPNAIWMDHLTGKETTVDKMVQTYDIQHGLESTSYWSGRCVLPPTLTYLAMRAFANVDDSFLMQDLRRLTTLFTPYANGFSDLGLSLLSRNITVLNVSKSNKITGHGFESLPKELTHLSLDTSTDILDEHIKDLPRGLVYLGLSSAVNLTDMCIDYLPKELERIYLDKNTKLSSSIVPKLPWKIRTSMAFKNFVTANWEVSRGQVNKK